MAAKRDRRVQDQDEPGIAKYTSVQGLFSESRAPQVPVLS